MANIINGTAGKDTIVGTTGDDIIDGLAGNDAINGGAGNDILYGNVGDDTLTGDFGADILYGGDGKDGMFGGGGNDTLYGEAGDDTMFGDANDDTLNGGSGTNKMDGGNGNDLFIVKAGEGTNTIIGNSGTDTVRIDFVSSDLTPSVRADLKAFSDWMQSNAASSTAVQLAAQTTTAPSFSLTSLNLTVSAVEVLTVTLNGQTVPLSQLLNTAPTAAATVSVSTLEDQVFTGQVVATDAQNDVLSYALTQGPAHGALTLDVNTGGYVYTPGENYNGADSFTVKVADPLGAFTEQTVNVGVTSVNDGPDTAATIAVTTDEDKPVSGQVVATDADGDVLGYAVATGPANGAVAVDAATGAFTYTPTANFNGADSFQVEVSDGKGGVVTQTVNVGVTPVVDAPVLSTSDLVVAIPGDALVGTNVADVLVGSGTTTYIAGAAGNDTIVAGTPGALTAALDIQAAISDAGSAETLSVSVSGVPAGATLSAGVQTLDGSWLLTGADLINLKITSATQNDFLLHVTATATDTNGQTASSAHDLKVTFDHSAVVNTIEGGSGSDQVTGSAGDDTIYGNTQPTLTVSLLAVSSKIAPSAPKAADNDVLHGGDGNDTIYGQRGDDQLFGENGNDWLSGGKGNDVLAGGAGSNILLGNSGDDTIVAGGGNDTVKGGTGFDTLDFSGANHGLTIDVSKGVASGFGDVTFSGIEKVIGSSFDDVYKGSSHDDVFIGGDGNDIIRGLDGADILTGGNGNDTFVYMKKDAGAIDHITDFAVGDRLDLHDFLKSAKYSSIGDVVHVTDTADGSLVSVKSGGTFVDLVILDGIHHTSAADLAAHSMILI